MEPAFVPGLRLSERYYREAVEPLLDKHFPALRHTAARIGGGSEVLGFDTGRSADHDWGPGLQLFLAPEDTENTEKHAAAITGMLAEELPKTFLGYPTHFVPGGGHVRHMRLTDGPVHHRVEVTELGGWLEGHLGFDPRRSIAASDWLATPTQTLAEVTAGSVFHDGLGELVPARENLRWYPDDVWRHVLACQWQRVSQEEAFVGRCGEVGDELGSAVVAARLVRDLMRLCLLMARRYPPYGKWLGSAFTQLPCAKDLPLTEVLSATSWRDRERHLARVYETAGALHNELGLTKPVDPGTRPYHDRPFQVLHAERFAEALTASVTDPEVAALPRLGAVDQYLDSTDLLDDRERTRAAADAVLRR
ncbi:DUF4037 domain-containing protein [Amycolatopsis sp.]|jgi:hypothetical protein|uniref:DUF4037 domain-containing protein n=1 Tax=Amycolatopsis sp. TaxID=37632 RepID=UPI002DFC45FF|nr:DUF4037 domain-containing protein [Amycolatopsis sp.]